VVFALQPFAKVASASVVAAADRRKESTMEEATRLLGLGALVVVLAAGCSSETTGSRKGELKDEFTPFTGAIFTTTKDGSVVDGNIYDDCRDVYLNGGPKNGRPGLPEGDYYFMVTSPSGGPPSVLLSSDGLAERMVHVGSSGEIETYLGNTHDTGKDTTGGGLTVQLWPFDETPNPGGEYKAWLTPVVKYSAGGGTFGFLHNWSKTDNFKCKIVAPPPPPGEDAGTPPGEDAGTPPGKDAGPTTDAGAPNPSDTGVPPPGCEGEDCLENM
jgi:hypothetical protein